MKTIQEILSFAPTISLLGPEPSIKELIEFYYNTAYEAGVFGSEAKKDSLVNYYISAFNERFKDL